jgi:hypothetical protein
MEIFTVSKALDRRGVKAAEQEQEWLFRNRDLKKEGEKTPEYENSESLHTKTITVIPTGANGNIGNTAAWLVPQAGHLLQHMFPRKTLDPTPPRQTRAGTEILP